MRNRLLISLGLATLALAIVGFAQEASPRADARCSAAPALSQPAYLPHDQALKLYLDRLSSEPETGDTGGAVHAAMARSGAKTGWVQVQVLVDERGQVQGVQNIEGTPSILSAAVREVQRYRFQPYVVAGTATPFVTVLRLKFDIAQPPCGLANPKACL